MHCVIHNTAIDINSDKLNCAEDRRVRSTTEGNLKLWFNTWEKCIFKYGFATINKNQEVVFDEITKAQNLNLDDTCLLLEGGNSSLGGHLTATYYNISFLPLGNEH